MDPETTWETPITPIDEKIQDLENQKLNLTGPLLARARARYTIDQEIKSLESEKELSNNSKAKYLYDSRQLGRTTEKNEPPPSNYEF